MTGREHYTEAERLLSESALLSDEIRQAVADPGTDMVAKMDLSLRQMNQSELLQRASVHAMLAYAAPAVGEA